MNIPVPFRDPIIYPGAPMPPKSWITRMERKCAVCTSPIPVGQRVQRCGVGSVACIDCADRWGMA